MPSDYIPRLSIDLTTEQQKELNIIFQQYGLKKLVFSHIINNFLALCQKHGAGEVIGAFTSGVIDLNKICRLNLKEK